MALKPCRECEEQVSSKAFMCPHCGIRFPVPRPATRPSTAFLVTFFVCCALLFVAARWEVPDTTRTGLSPRNVNLRAEIETRGTTVVVGNRNEFDWTACTVLINGRGSGFSAQVERIAAGSGTELDIDRFTKPDGERFNVLTHAIQRVSVLCDTPFRRGSARREGF